MDILHVPNTVSWGPVSLDMRCACLALDSINTTDSFPCGVSADD